jgi:hypothetical protein
MCPHLTGPICASKFVLSRLIAPRPSLIAAVAAPVTSDTGQTSWGHRYTVVEASEELEREGDRDDLDDELDHRHPQNKLRRKHGRPVREHDMTHINVTLQCAYTPPRVMPSVATIGPL